MSFFGKVKNFFVGVKVKVSAVFVQLFGQDAAEKFGHAALAILNTALGTIVQDAVLAVASLKIGGDAKRGKAFDKIVVDAKAKGIEASSSIVNMLIELAVTALVNKNITF
jgi:hypothetical protein